MSSIVGAVSNGTYTKNAASTEATGTGTTTNSSLTAASTGTSYDKEMFLQLLVAEMQYQDPLEPTSNSEYVAELASFSQIEAIQSVQDNMQTLEANSLVGQYVIIKEDNEYVSGKVDYVYNDSGDLYLAIGNKLYSIDNIDSVVDEAYYNAVLAAETFEDMISELPSVAELDLSDEAAITAARKVYDAMDSYTQGYVKSDALNTLKELENRLAALKKAADDDSYTTS